MAIFSRSLMDEGICTKCNGSSPEWRKDLVGNFSGRLFQPSNRGGLAGARTEKVKSQALGCMEA
jgi:hypothetical protein